ncbi:hypothetical protein NST17_20345 [Caldifermentibacillus hisashii]|uniref:Phage protein n=1 Tax=Caldifermentibacillus hisashii TaxID=996558 RepID=A0ABU9K649_9BACI
MQRWEVIKGIQEGVFKNGDRFEVTYPDGDMYYAGIDSQGILIWLHNETLVHISSYNEDDWKFIKNKLI